MSAPCLLLSGIVTLLIIGSEHFWRWSIEIVRGIKAGVKEIGKIGDHWPWRP